MGCYNQYKATGCSYTECKSMLHTLALWGLVTNYGEGGLQNGREGARGQVKFYPYKKKGGGGG